MITKLITATTSVAAMVGIAALAMMSPVAAEEHTTGQENREPISICHRTKAIKNPYEKITVDADSVDGDAGNDKGQGDHYLEHLGSIADPATMTNGSTWGDIIPAIPGVHAGRNWTSAGQAIYNANCSYPDEEELTPNTSASGICVVADQVVRITFVNSGTAASDISVNGSSSTVAAGATVNVTTPITGATASVNVVVDGEPSVITVNCPTGGSGGGTTTQQATGIATRVVAAQPTGGAGAVQVESLPVTSASDSQIGALATFISSIVATAGAYALRMRHIARL